MMRSRRIFAAWLAFFGIAFNALWPTIASAQPPTPGVPMVICTPTGFKTVQVDDAGTPVQAHGGKTHCALCAGPLDHVLPVIAAIDGITRVHTGLALPQSDSPLPAQRSSCHPPPAQAPPLHS